MSASFDDRHSPELDSADRRLVEQIREALRPEPMSEIRKAAFRRALDERIEGRGRWLRPLPTVLSLAAAGAAAVLLWTVPAPSPEPSPAEITRVTTEFGDAYFAALAEPADDFAPAADPEEYLPDQYLVLASLLDESL